MVLLWRVWTLWNYSAKMTFVFTGLFLCGSVFNLVIFISTRTAEGCRHIVQKNKFPWQTHEYLDPGPSVTSIVHCASQRYVQPLFFIFWVLLIVHHAGIECNYHLGTTTDNSSFLGILLLMLIPQGFSLRVYIWALSLSRAVFANHSREVRMQRWSDLINLINDIG